MAKPSIIMNATAGDVLKVTHYRDYDKSKKRMIYEGRVRSVLKYPGKGCFLEFEDRDYTITYLTDGDCKMGEFVIVDDIVIL